MTDHRRHDKVVAAWIVAALALALAGAVGSLWLSIGMDLKACPLCLYQRTFIMSVSGILLIGLMTPLRGSSVIPLLALPATIGGLGVAFFHAYLEATGALECPKGVFGVGTAPQQSLVVFILLAFSLTVGIWRGSKQNGGGLAAGAAAIIVGLLFSVGMILSAPPMRPAPSKTYEQPLDICRPPFRPLDQDRQEEKVQDER